MFGSAADGSAEVLSQELHLGPCIEVRSGDFIHSKPWEKNPILEKKKKKENEPFMVQTQELRICKI